MHTPKINFYVAVCGYYHSFISLAANDVLMLNNLSQVVNILLVIKNKKIGANPES